MFFVSEKSDSQAIIMDMFPPLPRQGPDIKIGRCNLDTQEMPRLVGENKTSISP